MRNMLLVRGLEFFTAEVARDVIDACRMANNGEMLLGARTSRQERRSKSSCRGPRGWFFDRFQAGRLAFFFLMRLLLLLLRFLRLRLFQLGKRRQTSARQKPHKGQLRIILWRFAPCFGRASGHPHHVDLRLTW